MGRSFWFECPKCAYRAKVSGGEDSGADVQVQTIICSDCRALHDAVTRLRVPDASPLSSWRLNFGRFRSLFLAPARETSVPPTFAAATNRLPYQDGPRLKWLHYRLQCPVSSIHRVTSWNDPGKCPKCGVYLEKSALPYRIWE